MAHENRAHAVLSASSSKRWLNCPPSAKLNAEIPDITTEYAKEGTDAHELAEYKVNQLLGIKEDNPTENLDYYNQEMEDCTDSYAQYIAEQMSLYSSPVVMVEQRLDFSKYVPGGFGTGDCIIVADEVLTVIDFKYGKGVAVEAEYNLAIAKYDFAPPDMLEDSEIEMILERADTLTAWAADVKKYALSEALKGRKWNGYKVVEGRSNRKYTDEKAVISAVKAAGKDPYSEPKILGINEMTKLLGGKKKFDELLNKYVCKPQGKPTLVPESDKRKEWSSAENDFQED